MVHFSAILSVFALYLSATVARPLPEDSSLGNEVGVSAPNGIVMSDTDELNRNRMLSTSDTPSPTSTDQPPPTDTWSPPPPLSTDDGKDKTPPSYTSTYAYPPDYTSTSTYTSPPDYTSTSVYDPQPTYGSGSNSWGGNQYDDCVKQCQVKYPSMTPPKDTPKDAPPSKTHVVWVAPTQGVLRYVPFAVNASVGDTVKFIWGANNHTVTKGSQLSPCNKTADSPFASGVQLKDFVFEQVVNDTNPTFFYCAVPTHCTKGMFGIINPPNALGGPSSVGSMMQSMVDANPDLGKMRTYADNATKTSDPASKWGTNFDMGSIPDWAHESFVENVLYSRTFLAANPEAFTGDGGIDASLGGNPPVIPPEITKVALDNTPGYGSPDYGSGPANPSSVTSTNTVVPTSTPSAVDSSSNLSNGGSASVARSGLTVIIAALAAGFFLL